MSKKTGQRPTQLVEPLSGANRAYLEDLFNRSQQDPAILSPEWTDFFARLPEETASPKKAAEDPGRERDDEAGRKQAAVLRLINAYRTRGHSIAKTDPLGIASPSIPGDFDLSFQELSEDDLGLTFGTGSLAFGPETLSLKDIRDLCHDVYCGPLGV